MNAEVDKYAISASQDMYDIVGEIQRDLLDDEDEIMADVLDYQQQVQTASEQTTTMKDSVLETMDLIESVEDNRSVVFAIFFMIPMVLLIFGFCGWFLGGKNGQNLFKLNYCLAFILSTVTWIIFAFFNITVIIWADTCVRLDVMETNITGSALLDQVYSTDTVKKVMDSCIYGKYLPDAFNLTSTIAFSELEDEIVNQLTVDLVGVFDIATINTFRDFVTTLDKTSYTFTLDAYIIAYNTQFDLSLTRAELIADDGSHSPPSPTSQAAYNELRSIYNKEQEFMNDGTFQDRTDRFKVDAGEVLNLYNDLETFAIYTLQGNLTDIKCSLNPVFEQADILLYGNSTAWCNQVGVLYGDMKTKGCVDLFKNFEYTNRSLLVIAIFSMFIGFLSVALGRRINRKFNLFAQKAHEFLGGDRWS
jgi:hypothetical protein